MKHAHTTDMDALIADAQRRLDVLRESYEQLDRIRVSVSSPNNLVTVVADGTGAMIGLELAENLTAVSVHTLVTTITDTAARAASAGREQHSAILQTLQISFTGS